MKTIWRFQGIFGHLDQSHNHKATSTRYFSLNPKPENPDFGDKYFIHTILHNVANFTHNLFLFICLTLTFMNKLHVHHLFEFYESMVFLEVVKVIKD